MKTDTKLEVQQRKLRTFRMGLCYQFCHDLLAKVCVDSVNLQTMMETDRIRKRAYLMPKETFVFDLFTPTSGEHQYAGYREEPKSYPKDFSKDFMDQKTKKINSFWRLPSNHEIIQLQDFTEEFKTKN